MYYSGAVDNTHNPPDYLETLEGLTGTEYERLVKGHWVQAEGVVHDNWDASCQPGGRRGLAVATGVAAHRRD